MSTKKNEDLPIGTTSESSRLHTIIRRVCYVLLFGLVFEGALTLPLTLVWYGFPTLSPQEVCSGLRQVMYDNPSAECQSPYPLGGPPFGGTPESAHEVGRDKWGVQPTPEYPRIGFRELVDIYHENEQKTAEAPR